MSCGGVAHISVPAALGVFKEMFPGMYVILLL